jgi:hypothetical protein
MEEREILNHRLEGLAWGVFLVMLGALWLMPANTVPEDLWLVGAGLIMLGLNFARYLNRMAVSGFTITIGAVALAIGLAGSFGLRLPIFALALIAIGFWIMLSHTVRRRPHVSRPA